jgi:hypothetical protein
MAKVALPKFDPPGLFCHACRRWVESQERVEMFETVDGVRRPLTTWTCPECRGVAAPGEVVVARESETGADASREERHGPYRDVVAGTFAMGASGKSGRARLSCGHDYTVLPGAKRQRCSKCKPKKGGGS